jgi:hypothetical protein
MLVAYFLSQKHGNSQKEHKLQSNGNINDNTDIWTLITALSDFPFHNLYWHIVDRFKKKESDTHLNVWRILMSQCREIRTWNIYQLSS